MRSNFYHYTPMLILALVFSLLYAQAENPLKDKYILVLDMQEIGTKKMLSPEAAQQLIDNVNKVIERSDPEKVIYVEAIMAKLAISLTGLQVEVEDGMRLDERLKLVNDTRIVKTKASAFTAEDLKTFIETHKADEFVIVGLMAEHCINATAVEGIETGYKVAVIPEAIAAESEEGKTEVLKALREKGIEIIPLAEL